MVIPTCENVIDTTAPEIWNHRRVNKKIKKYPIQSELNLSKPNVNVQFTCKDVLGATRTYYPTTIDEVWTEIIDIC